MNTNSAQSPKDSIVTFAEVQAALSDPFGDRDVTLALRGFDERAWQSIEAAWAIRLAKNNDEAAELARAYGDAFEAARAAPGKGREPTKSLAQEMSEATAAPGQATPGQATPGQATPPIATDGLPEVEEAKPAQRPMMVPSFLRDRAPGPAAPLPVSAASLVPPVTPAPPAMVSAPAVLPPVVPPPVSAATPGYGETGAVDLGAILKSAVPFDPSAKPPVPAIPQPPARLSKSALSGETADVDIAAIARQVLAFGASRPAAASPTAGPRPVASPPAGSPPAANKPVVSPPVASPPPANKPHPAPAAVPVFTLDQYAQLSAEIALDADPSARAAVFVRYGVQSPDALTAEWRARFTADPALAGRWSAAYAHHYARLRAERLSRR